MATDRSLPPDANKLLRFIKAAGESTQSPLRHLREFYRLAERECAGPWWQKCHELGTRKADARRPYNQIGEMLRTYAPHLIGDSILPVVEPSGVGTREDADMLQMLLRQWSDDAGYAATDEMVVVDSILAVGVQYVYRNATGVTFENGTLNPGEPAVARISVENMVLDPEVGAQWDHAAGEGHWAKVDRQLLLERGIGDPDVIKRLPNVWDKNVKETQGSNINRNPGGDDQYLEDLVPIWEFCFRHSGRRYGCSLPPIDGGVTDFVVPPYELTGEPEGSRYVVTALDSMPNSPFPLSPAMVMMDAHLGKSAVIAKLYEQIEKIDRMYAIAPGMVDAVMRLKNGTPEGYVICDPTNIKEFITGGMVKELLDAFAFLDQLGEKIGPQVSQLAGMSPNRDESATLTATKASNGAVVMGRWKRKIDDGRVRVLRRVAAMLLGGADRRVFQFQTPAGMVPLVWDAATNDLSYDNFKYRMKPSSSTAGLDARTKLLNLVDILGRLPAVLQVIAGMGADPQRAIRVISDLAAMPELDEMLPTGDSASLQAKIFQMLAQNGQATPVGMGGGSMPPSSPPTGPRTRTGQVNSNVQRLAVA